MKTIVDEMYVSDGIYIYTRRCKKEEEGKEADTYSLCMYTHTFNSTFFYLIVKLVSLVIKHHIHKSLQ